MHRIPRILCVLCVLCLKTQAAEPPIATFSIVAFDPATGELGVAVQSKFFSVGSVVPWAKAGVGAVATQSWANIQYGPDGLALLAKGKSPAEVVKALTAPDARREFRQLGIVDAKGRAASFTGKRCMDWAGHVTGKHFAAQGNILAGEAVVKNMAAAFEKARQQPKPPAATSADGSPPHCWWYARRAATMESPITTSTSVWPTTKRPSRNWAASSSSTKHFSVADI